MALSPISDVVRAVSPALERYTREHLLGEVWQRPGLSPRDRGIVTVAALIARNQTADLGFYMALALDSGVRPIELSELITHLAFYAGWGNAMSAVSVAHAVFAERGIGAGELAPAQVDLLAIEPQSEAQRAAAVQKNVGPVSPGLVHYTGALLFHDVWLRPALATRDRCLVTVASLIASGQSAQLGFHLNRAMDHGLTQVEASEMLAHLAFYAGWPNAFSAAAVAKDVFEARPQ